MSLEDKAIDQITEADLQQLVESGVPEGRDLDFKQATYGNADSDKREYLADISSFANTVGGHLLIGVEEEEGVAKAVVGIQDDPDQERTRLEEIARSGLQPRINGLRIVAVPTSRGRNVIVARVPRSWNPPHRVIAKRSHRFWARDGGGKYEPDVDQLRELFLVAPSIADRVRDFRAERIARIAAGDPILPLARQSALVLHIFPFESFAAGKRLEISKLYDQHRSFRPIASMDLTGRVNLDGVVVVTGAARGAPWDAYTQVWRSGFVEAVDSLIVSEQYERGIIFSAGIEEYVFDVVPGYIEGLKTLGISLPFAVFITLANVDGVRLDQRRDSRLDERDRFDRPIINTSEVVLTEWPKASGDVPKFLRPAFDEIANAAGRFGSPNFDSDGNWRRA